MEDIINIDLQFYSFFDFFNKKEKIKKIYKTLSLREKRIFKMYVYSLCFETEHTKDVIWEYLNSVDKFTDLQIYKEYGIRVRRNKRNGNSKMDISNSVDYSNNW